MVDRPSAIDVAWSDVVLRVMGLAGRSRGEAKSFFGLSDAELDRIAAGSWRCPVRPAWQVAVRIRNVECPRLENRIVGSVVALLLVIRSEEHTSELQSLMRISYAVFCLKKKKIYTLNKHYDT